MSSLMPGSHYDELWNTRKTTAFRDLASLHPDIFVAVPMVTMQPLQGGECKFAMASSKTEIRAIVHLGCLFLLLIFRMSVPFRGVR